MMKIDKRLPLEEQKAKSGEGFDTRIKGMNFWVKAALILLAIIGAGLIIYEIMNSSDGGRSVSGGVRNCILSAMGNAPDCSDDDGMLKRTTANGRDLGYCYGLDTSGNCIK